MMTRMIGKRGLRALVVTNTLAMVLTGLPPVAFAQYQPAPYQTAPVPGQPAPQGQPGAGPVINAGMPGDLSGFDQPWPRQVQMNGQALTVYQPQVEAWNGNVLELKAAVGLNVDAPNQADQHFGQVFLTARSDVDKERGAVWLSDVQVTRVLLPTAPQRAGEVEQALESPNGASGGGVVARVIALDQLQSSIAIAKAQRSADMQIEVLNDAPQIIFSQEASVLVVMDGEPVLREVAPNLQRVVNTNVLLLREASSGRYFLRVAGYWATTPDFNSPWTIAYESQPTFDQIKQQALNEGGVDLLDDDDKPGPYNVLPAIYVASQPTELLQTDGAPQFVPIDGTRLLYVQNSASDIFLDTQTQDHYVLISGRWFRARGFEGPWAYVDGQNLPPDFRRIPEAHPKGVVLVSIPGTPQAQEAAIANTIPQTATIDRQTASFDPYYDGQPQFAPVEGTPLHYAQNAPVPVIQVDPNSYYAVENGVWFTAPAPTGPWIVATVVPPVIYTIPPSSPVYYATYVRVYRATPRYVYVGYTPGYFGTYVSRRGTVVYGSGYHYKPWVGRTYYARPSTYGAGVGFAAGSFIGFAAGLATAAIVGEQFWGPHYDGRRDRRDDRRDNRGWDRRNDWGGGRSVVRAPEPGRPGGRAPAGRPAAAGRDVVVNYQTNVYNTWSDKTVVRTSTVQPATAPATLRERQRRVEELRQSSQQNRERGAERRAGPTPAAVAPAQAQPAPAAPQQAQPNRPQDGRPDNRGRFGQNTPPGQDREDRDRNRDNRPRPPVAAPGQPPGPAQAAPSGPARPGAPQATTPGATLPAAAAPSATTAPGTPGPNAARDQAERQRRQQDEAARAQRQQQENAARAQQEQARRGQMEQQRRQQDEAARAQRQQQENAARAQQEQARRGQMEQQRRQQDEAARAQRQQQENAARAQQEQARRGQMEQQRRQQDEAARAQRQQQENAARAQQEQARRGQMEQQRRQQDEAARAQRQQQENAARAQRQQQDQARQQAEQARRAQENAARAQAEQARRQAPPPQAAPQAQPQPQPQAQPQPQPQAQQPGGGRPPQGGGGGGGRGRDRKNSD